MERNLIQQLVDVRWTVMSRTYGSSHSTLIGLLVEWWVNRGSDYSALEGGPTCAPPETVQPGQRGGQCDAILMRNNLSSGVLEVEGTRYEYTIPSSNTSSIRRWLICSNWSSAFFLGMPSVLKGKECCELLTPCRSSVGRNLPVTSRAAIRIAKLLSWPSRKVSMSARVARGRATCTTSAEHRAFTVCWFVTDGKSTSNRSEMPDSQHQPLSKRRTCKISANRQR